MPQIDPPVLISVALLPDAVEIRTCPPLHWRAEARRVLQPTLERARSMAECDVGAAARLVIDALIMHRQVWPQRDATGRLLDDWEVFGHPALYVPSKEEGLDKAYALGLIKRGYPWPVPTDDQLLDGG